MVVFVCFTVYNLMGHWIIIVLHLSIIMNVLFVDLIVALAPVHLVNGRDHWSKSFHISCTNIKVSPHYKVCCHGVVESFNVT